MKIISRLKWPDLCTNFICMLHRWINYIPGLHCASWNSQDLNIPPNSHQVVHLQKCLTTSTYIYTGGYVMLRSLFGHITCCTRLVWTTTHHRNGIIDGEILYIPLRWTRDRVNHKETGLHLWRPTTSLPSQMPGPADDRTFTHRQWLMPRILHWRTSSMWT